MRSRCPGQLALAVWLFWVGLLPSNPAAAEQPALIVVVAVDQLRRDRLDPALPGGIGRLMGQGRVFAAASLDHAVSSTCPGHAVILTGANPARAGIPGNEYIDRESWRERYCFAEDSDAYRVHGGEDNRSPRNLRVTAFGDWLKASHPESKVFVVGGKDRAVIAMAGHHPDGAYWFHSGQGRFTSSRYYTKALPDYIRTFNGNDPLVDGFLSNLPVSWVHAPGPWRKDDFRGENDRHKRHSAHPLGKGSLEKVAARFRDSPWQDTAVFTLARRIIQAEALGTDGSPDLLALALSASDSVGHLYGPFSGESVDTLRNLDRELGAFLEFLDDRFGSGRVVVVLTADHGVVALPEWTAERGMNECPVDSGRVDVYGFVLRLYWYIYRRFTFPFGMPTRLVKFAGQQISVNRDYARARNLDVEVVIRLLEERLEREPSVREAWTVAEVGDGTSDEARLFRNSLVEGMSGDLIVQVHRGCVIRGRHGTNHGTVYDYDRQIPLVFYGWGVEPGRVDGVAHSVDVAPTLAKLIGLQVPVSVDGSALPLGQGMQPAAAQVPAPGERAR